MISEDFFFQMFGFKFINLFHFQAFCIFVFSFIFGLLDTGKLKFQSKLSINLLNTAGMWDLNCKNRYAELTNNARLQRSEYNAIKIYFLGFMAI